MPGRELTASALCLTLTVLACEAQSETPQVPHDPVRRVAIILEVFSRKALVYEKDRGKETECAIPLLLAAAYESPKTVKAGTERYLHHKWLKEERASVAEDLRKAFLWNREDVGRLITEMYWAKDFGWISFQPDKGIARMKGETFPYTMNGLWLLFHQKWEVTEKSSKRRDLTPYAGQKWSSAKLEKFILSSLKDIPFSQGKWKFEN